MQTLADKLLDLRNFVSRYGKILNDESCEFDGQHYRKTVYLLEGHVVTINMCNGEVNTFHYS